LAVTARNIEFKGRGGIEGMASLRRVGKASPELTGWKGKHLDSRIADMSDLISPCQPTHATHAHVCKEESVKIIEITHCIMCPYVTRKGKEDYQCGMRLEGTVNTLTVEDVLRLNGMPSWCPLSDADRTSSGQVAGQKEGK